jgi:hypothetical protein
MSSIGTRYSKLTKTFIEPEATACVYEPISAASFPVPAIGNTKPVADRGSRIIDRTNVVDAGAGDIAGVPGSYGWSYSLEAELHVPAVAGPDYATIGYWGTMLLASGFGLTVDADGTGDYFEYTLDTRPFDDYAGGDGQGPAAASITVVQNNNETSDWQMKLRGCTGVASFEFTPGEIATITTAFKGIIEGTELIDTSDVDISASGPDFALNLPLVVKGISLTVVDVTNGSTPVNVQALQSLSIAMNSEHPDLMDPTETDGYALSPVFHNTSPTVSFTFPDTADVDDTVMQALKDGRILSIDVELQAASGGNRFVKFTMPQSQFIDVTLQDNGGMLEYSVNAKLVRQPGEPASSLLSIKYYHTLL